MWNKESIQALLDTNDRAVERALVAIYHRQTDSEKASDNTTNANGVGFSAYDAPLLSDIAKKCIYWRGLTNGQLRLVRPKVRRYWRQLAEIANAKLQAAQPAAVQSQAMPALHPDDVEMARMEREAENAAMSRELAREAHLVGAGDHL